MEIDSSFSRDLRIQRPGITAYIAGALALRGVLLSSGLGLGQLGGLLLLLRGEKTKKQLLGKMRS